MHLASPLITKKLKKIVAWLTLAFYLGQPTLSLAQVVADPQAGKNRPIIDTAANGVSVVQITTPSAAGVSRNQYTHFNVPTNGLILNNSAAITQTQLGGYISGNSSIGNRPARIILNEVTSANPSHLRGYTEVAGQRADVIIANPNGIVGNGFGFINTSRAVLTTGVPVFGGSGSLEAFRVSRGQIRIEGQGLDASTTDRLDILSRAATINAGIWAQELNLVTGANQIRYDTLATQKISGEDSQPQVALDVGLLGGMYANKIRLIGTEQGVGVNSQGNLSATSGDIRVTQTGKVILAGHTGATGQIQIQTDDSFTNQGTLHAGGDAQIHTGQDIRNTGSLTAGGHFTLAGATLQSSGTIAAGLTTAGNIGDTGDLTITVSVADLSGAKTYAGGNADFAIQNTLDTSDAILQANGHLNIQAQQILNSHGTLAAGRNLTLNTPDGLDNTQGFLYAGQNLTLNPTAYLTNIQGQIGAGHDLWTETQRFTNTGGLLAANNNLTFTTQGTLTNQGVMKATGALFLNAVSIHNQQDGLLNAGAIQLTADTDIANQGRIDGGLTQTTSQTFTNTGIFFSDNLIIKANHIHNTGEEAIIGATGNAWYFAGSLLENKDGAILYGQGDLIVAADEEQDANGFYTHLTGNILNQSATIESDGNIGLFAQKITNKKREFAVEQQEVSRTTKTEDIPYSAPYYKASRTYTEVVTETVVTKDSDPGQILAGGNMILRGSIENNVSTITAGGHLDFDSDRLTNISYANTRIITQAGTSSYTRRERYCKHKIMGSCVDHSHRDVTDRDPVNEQFSENISGYASIISGNQSISGVVGSIDNLTLGVDNAPVGGMASTLLGQTTGSAGSDNPSGYTFRIPANSLYATHTDPNAKYLVEINPRFTEKNQFLGSDYMLERIATDPASVQKRLGDGYYEQKLIRDQLTLLTGRQFLDNYTSSEEQYKALLDNGIAAAETFHLTVGVALTPEQIQALTQDIVWMVEQEIQGQKVWVPVVYLAGARDMELRPDGALIAAKEIDITTTGNLTNSGSIKADKLLLNVQNLTNRGGLLSGADTLQITATNNILNQSGRIAGGDLLLSAGGDIKNETLTTTLTAEQASPQPAKGLSTRFGIGQQTASNSEHTTTLVHQAGSIEATGNLTLTAGQDISMNGAQAVAGQNLTLSAGRNLELDTVEHHEQYSVDSRKYKAEYDATHHIATSLAAGGDIQLLAQNGATLKGAQIDAGQDLTLAAGNVTVTAVKDHMLDDSNKIGYDGNFRRDRTDDETVQGSKLEAGNNLTIAATHAGDSKKSGQGNVNVAGSYLVTKTDETGVPLGEGNLRILADNQVHIQEMHERHESLKESQTSSGNLLSTTTTYTREHALLNQAKGSTLSGEQVDIQAGQDLTVRGSELGASNDLSLRGETVTIESAQTTFESDSYTYTKKSGLSISFDGGLNVFAGSSKTKTAEAAEGTEQKKSAVGSLNGKVTIEADKDVQIKASDITGKTGIDITGQNVAVEAAADTTHSHNTYQFKQTGFTLTAGNTVVSTATQAVNSVERATQVEDGRLAALHGIKAIETGNQAWQKAQGTDPDTGKPIDPKKDNPAKIKVSLSVGSSQQKSESHTHTSTSVGSSLQSEQQINIIATGSGEKDVAGQAKDGDIRIGGSSVNGKDILLDAANDVNLESAANTVDSRSESSQKSASVGVDLASGGVTISGQRGNGNTDAHQVNYNETLITAENNLTVKSGSDINIVGGQAKGDIVKVEASGDLNLASQQDRETYTEKNKSTNGSIGIGAGVTGNVGVNKGKIDSDYQSVKEQTGIFAGSGGFAIKVEGNTDLKGAVIGSEATTDKNKLDTGSLTWSDIENKAEYEASNSGLSLDFKDGKLTSDLTPDMPVNGDAASTTQSAVAAGSIEIRTGNTDISQLNRNTDQALNTLGTIFDKKTVQEKQELVNMFSQEANKAIGDLAESMWKKAATPEEKAKWAEGGEYKALLHAVAGGITSNLSGNGFASGAAGDGISQLAQKELGKIADPNLRLIASAAIGAAAAKAVGGNEQAGAVAAFNGVKYNDYNHRTHREGEIVHTKDGWFQVINGDDTSIDAPPPGVYFWEQDPDNGDYGWDYEKGDGGLTKRDTYFAGIVKDQYFFNWNGKLRTITVLDETDAQKKERLKGKLGEFAYGVTILGLGYSGSSVIGKFGIGKYVAVGNKAANAAETLSETTAKGAAKVDVAQPVGTAKRSDSFIDFDLQLFAESGDVGKGPTKAAPGTSNTKLNIGAGDNPQSGYRNVDIDPKIASVEKMDANNLSSIKTASQAEVLVQNPRGFNPLESDIPRVMQPDGKLTIVGNMSNKDFNKIFNMSEEQLARYGFKLETKGVASDALTVGCKTTDGKDIIASTLKQIVLVRIGK